MICNGVTYFLGKHHDYTEKYFYYDPWDRYMSLIEKKDSWLEKGAQMGLNLWKRCATMVYSKNEDELKKNLGFLFVFGRPLELLIGGRVLVYTFIASLATSFLCTIPSRANIVKSDPYKNSFAYTFSLSVPFLFFFANFTKEHRLTHVLSFLITVYMIFFGNYDYEIRPCLLASILIQLYLKVKFKAI
jgi:hypothetical protein